ncbi:hypothetical protein HBI79_097710 [Parastagonospora nodorum]|nr:hypothetical protein HBI79_097710 [Parastagonospora nodorum]KAH5237066.1 hypothetical protein HBI71_244460 [Parastagonospora nodorum]KAH5424745.1 hypothetical protein HBI47_121210 [Parastagonospora nodorum]
MLFCQPDQSNPLPASFSTLTSRIKLPALQEITLYAKGALNSDGISGRIDLIRPINNHIKKDYDALMNAIDARGSSQTPAKPTNLHVKLEAYGVGNIRTLLPSKASIHLKRVVANRENYALTYKSSIATALLRPQHTNRPHDNQRTNGLAAKQDGDFSNFTALLRLRVPAGVWFVHAALGPINPPNGFVWMVPNSRPSIRAFLPRSLQELRVDFIYLARIFVAGAVYQDRLVTYTIGKAALLDKLRTAYNWMTELVDPVTGLKKLKCLQLLEGSMKKDTQILVWDLPAELLNAFERAGVQFELRIRTRASSNGEGI